MYLAKIINNFTRNFFFKSNKGQKRQSQKGKYHSNCTCKTNDWWQIGKDNKTVA